MERRFQKIVSNPDVRPVIEVLGQQVGMTVEETFRISAWLVMLGEWFAAISSLVARLRPLAFFIVPWFHIMVEWIGFDIELFFLYTFLNLALLSPSVFETSGSDSFKVSKWFYAQVSSHSLL